MHKNSRIKILPAAFMLVLFLVVSFFGSEGTFICFGEDGHVAIEFSDVCKSPGVGLQHPGMENDACGPCKDVQFLSSPAYTGNASHNAQTLSLISSSPVLSSLIQDEYSNNLIILPVSSHHKTLASLHSVILLI